MYMYLLIYYIYIYIVYTQLLFTYAVIYNMSLQIIYLHNIQTNL